jgi:hypothetical protein
VYDGRWNAAERRKREEKKARKKNNKWGTEKESKIIQREK